MAIYVGGVRVDEGTLLEAGEGIRITETETGQRISLENPDGGGAATAEQVSFTPPEGMTADNVQAAIGELFQSVSEGKALIASAVTDKGVETAADASFQTMHDNILAIPSGGLPEDVCTITLTANPPEGGTVSGGGVVSNGMDATITIKAEKSGNYQFNGWSGNTDEPILDNPYTFRVSRSLSLTANFIIPEYVSGKDWWLSKPMPGGERGWNSIAYGNGKFVSVRYDYGGTNEAAYSQDGITWESTALPSTKTWNFVTFAGGKFFATANTNTAYAYSADGISWTEKAFPKAASWRIAYGVGKFVAVAYSIYNPSTQNHEKTNMCVTSTDGISWVSATLPSKENWKAISFANGKFVAIADKSNQAAYSADGVKWELATLPEAEGWTSIAYGNGRFVAVSSKQSGYYKGEAAYSDDAINWTAAQITASNSQYFQSITFGDGKFVALGSSGINTICAYSEDGASWTEVSLPTSGNQWQGVTYGNGKFVAVCSYNGESAYSYTGSEPPT